MFEPPYGEGVPFAVPRRVRTSGMRIRRPRQQPHVCFRPDGADVSRHGRPTFLVATPPGRGASIYRCRESVNTPSASTVLGPAEISVRRTRLRGKRQSRSWLWLDLLVDRRCACGRAAARPSQESRGQRGAPFCDGVRAGGPGNLHLRCDGVVVCPGPKARVATYSMRVQPGLILPP